MDIRCTQNTYQSANGVSRITYYILQPEGVEKRGVIQLSHGMCEYFSRYTVFAKYLCSLGFIVCGNDHLGHGASVTRGADLGFFAVSNGWKYLVQDMESLTDIMQTRYPDLPYFLFGHDMGSLIARIYLDQYGERLRGCILCGSPGPSPFTKTAVRLSNSISHTKGITYRSAFLSRLAFRGYNRKIAHPHSVFDWISRDPEIVELYESDTKCNFVFTASGFRDLFLLMLYANSARCFRHTPRELPLLLLAGDHDPVTGYGDGVRQIATAYRAAGVKDVDVIFYKGGRHELINEINRQEVYGDISRWLEQRLLAVPDTTEAIKTGSISDSEQEGKI